MASNPHDWYPPDAGLLWEPAGFDDVDPPISTASDAGHTASPDGADATPVGHLERMRAAAGDDLIKALQSVRLAPLRSQGLRQAQTCQTLGEVAELVRLATSGGEKRRQWHRGVELRKGVAANLPWKLHKLGFKEAAGLMAVLNLQFRPDPGCTEAWLQSLSILPERYPAEALAGYPNMLNGVEGFLRDQLQLHESGEHPLKPQHLDSLTRGLARVKAYGQFLSQWRCVDPDTGLAAIIPVDDRHLPASAAKALAEAIERTHTESLATPPTKKPRTSATPGLVRTETMPGEDRATPPDNPVQLVWPMASSGIQPAGPAWAVQPAPVGATESPGSSLLDMALNGPEMIRPPLGMPVFEQAATPTHGLPTPLRGAAGIAEHATALMATPFVRHPSFPSESLMALHRLAGCNHRQQVRDVVATQTSVFHRLLALLVQLTPNDPGLEALTTELALVLLEETPNVDEPSQMNTVLQALSNAHALPRNRPFKPGLFIKLHQAATPLGQSALAVLESLVNRSL